MKLIQLKYYGIPDNKHPDKELIGEVEPVVIFTLGCPSPDGNPEEHIEKILAGYVWNGVPQVGVVTHLDTIVFTEDQDVRDLAGFNKLMLNIAAFAALLPVGATSALPEKVPAFQMFDKVERLR